MITTTRRARRLTSSSASSSPLSQVPSWRHWSVVGVLLVALVVAPPAPRAQSDRVPVPTQLKILVRVLEFERNLAAHAGDDIVMGIVFQSGYRSSLRAKDELLEAMAQSGELRVQDKAVRPAPIDFDEAELVDAIVDSGVDVLYVTPLRAVDLEEVVSVSRSLGITTLTGVVEYVEDGLAVGIGLRSQKAEIVINLPAARAEGADFSSRLLKLARILD